MGLWSKKEGGEKKPGTGSSAAHKALSMQHALFDRGQFAGLQFDFQSKLDTDRGIPTLVLTFHIERDMKPTESPLGYTKEQGEGFMKVLHQAVVEKAIMGVTAMHKDKNRPEEGIPKQPVSIRFILDLENAEAAGNFTNWLRSQHAAVKTGESIAKTNPGDSAAHILQEYERGKRQPKR